MICCVGYVIRNQQFTQHPLSGYLLRVGSVAASIEVQSGGKRTGGSFGNDYPPRDTMTKTKQRLLESKREKWIRELCDCGAQHGLVDGNYPCTESCFTKEIRQALDTMREETEKKLAKSLGGALRGAFDSVNKSLDKKLKSNHE
jgi:hypothetical protein